MATSGIPRALAGDQSNSKSESGNSSAGSNGSSDSSKTSGGTSQDSADSSKNSQGSTETSPEDSTRYFARGTTDESTNSRGGRTFSVVVAVVALGASVGGTAIGMSATQRRKEREAAAAVAAFMRRNHALLTHDVVMAGGPVLDAWGHDLGLSAAEKRRFARTLEGSIEQGAMVDALDGPIDEGKARRFSVTFLRAAERALGRTRAQALVAFSSRRAGGG